MHDLVYDLIYISLKVIKHLLKIKSFFENAFVCNFCGKLFSSKSYLRMHDLIYH